MEKKFTTASTTAPLFLVFAGALLLLVLCPNPAFALNAVTIDRGYGLDDTRLLRLSLAMNNERTRPANDDWSWGHYWEANLSYWYLYKNKKGVDHLVEAGITPNIRYERRQAWGWGGRPYIEAGLGVHMLSKVHIGTRDLSSSFQFGSHLGIGLRFGAHEHWDLAWRVEHLSNADLKQPNPGINFAMIRLGYRW